ncbi:hypothetical protein HRW07_07540 [Streptomyces lunaelactis]|nr:hypothetical protein [Streptomyces lunaelactis]
MSPAVFRETADGGGFREVGSGAYPRLAAAFADGIGALDPDEVFERVLTRVLDAFQSSAN